MTRTARGTPYFISPEMCKNSAYNNKSDIWSLGCILYELMTLHHPFNGHNLKGLVKNIMNSEVDLINE